MSPAAMSGSFRLPAAPASTILAGMLPDHERFALLHGPYAPPPFALGDILTCEVRGDLRVTGVSSGRIQWPVSSAWGGNGSGRRFLILTPELARAVRLESVQALRYWFGVSSTTVWKWRKALGVDGNNDGTRKLRARMASLTPPELREQIAATQRGKARPRHVIEAMTAGRIRAAQERRAKP
jgi:transposase-like protein